MRRQMPLPGSSIAGCPNQALVPCCIGHALPGSRYLCRSDQPAAARSRCCFSAQPAEGAALRKCASLGILIIHLAVAKQLIRPSMPPGRLIRLTLMLSPPAHLKLHQSSRNLPVSKMLGIKTSVYVSRKGCGALAPFGNTILCLLTQRQRGQNEVRAGTVRVCSCSQAACMLWG